MVVQWKISPSKSRDAARSHFFSLQDRWKQIIDPKRAFLVRGTAPEEPKRNEIAEIREQLQDADPQKAGTGTLGGKP
jgi:hypothetical protein